jgi:hypothetical protein
MLATAAKALICAAALSLLAQDAGLSGDWVFTSHERGPDGQPVCTELWRFGPDGAMTIESGEEVLRLRYRFEGDETRLWLNAQTLSANGEPDCRNRRTDGVRPGEYRNLILPGDEGDFVVCTPPLRTSDGMDQVGPRCFGVLVPAG